MFSGMLAGDGGWACASAAERWRFALSIALVTQSHLLLDFGCVAGASREPALPARPVAALPAPACRSRRMRVCSFARLRHRMLGALAEGDDSVRRVLHECVSSYVRGFRVEYMRFTSATQVRDLCGDLRPDADVESKSSFATPPPRAGAGRSSPRARRPSQWALVPRAPGPVFSNVLLVEDVDRAPPETQARAGPRRSLAWLVSPRASPLPCRHLAVNARGPVRRDPRPHSPRPALRAPCAPPLCAPWAAQAWLASAMRQGVVWSPDASQPLALPTPFLVVATSNRPWLCGVLSPVPNPRAGISLPRGCCRAIIRACVGIRVPPDGFPARGEGGVDYERAHACTGVGRGSGAGGALA